PREWRGLGTIPCSGLGLTPDYEACDAARRFPTPQPITPPSTGCISGLILQGLKKPGDCPHFGTRCT
ncbi:MAG: hydrogenase formation protein HypD, partial [Akkermansiaceae bacterium]|nr:hydrogenase formation protein HypD [Akkermansiaceae bacterium]